MKKRRSNGPNDPSKNGGTSSKQGPAASKPPIRQTATERSPLLEPISESSALSAVLPNSKRIYVGGKIHPEIKVPFREISLAPTKTMSDEIEVNEPVRVYDTSGPWGDDHCRCDVEHGLEPLRRDWILKRGDVEEIEGRVVRPIDDGFLSDRKSTRLNSSHIP